MFVATLLVDPQRCDLDYALVETLRTAWNGGGTTWLSPDEAAAFEVGRVPDDLWDTWTDLQRAGVDLVLQPTAARRKKMLLADMDGTMIRQECIDELADMAGVGDHVKEITMRAMNGELDFERALTERVGLLAGVDAGVIDRVLEERITLAPGGRVLVGTMKANGGYAALVSGGFTAFADPVAGHLGFDESQANTLLVSNGRLTGGIGHPVLDRRAKVEALERITARLGIARDDVLAVGDGSNDLDMLKRAGTGVALHAKTSVQKEIPVRVNHGDLTALLYLQGYARADFVHRPL
ncbi:MAG: phosphoserine phosphatase SerB [Pseudomonadota bacterium]